LQQFRLVWVDRTGKELGTVGEPGDYSNPALSPDERRLAVGRMDPRARRDIWVFDLIRGTSSRLTFDPADDMNPTWSPDGNWIAFTSDRKGQRNLYRKLASGTGEDEILWESEERKNVEDWSRDGRTILMNCTPPGKTGPDVWALPLTGDRKPVPVLSGAYSEDQAQLSPDGRWLAYRSSESGRSQIYVQNFPPSGGKWQISTEGGNDPQWRRDGKELFYISGSKLMAVEIKAAGATVEAGLPKELFELRAGPILRNRYVPAANGQRFLVVGINEQTSSAPIHVVLNWQAGLRR
jgi:Tol biopolymer transport system component